MNQKYIGIILIIIGVLLVFSVFMIKANEDKVIDDYISVNNSCYLTDGTCLHDDRNMTGYIIGWIISGCLIVLGLFLLLVDKTQEMLHSTHKEFVKTVSEDKKEKEFLAFLSGFDEDRAMILKSIHDNDGITQSTLRFKTGLSKAHLSILINDLEKKKIISRRKKGKTFEVFLVNKF